MTRPALVTPARAGAGADPAQPAITRPRLWSGELAGLVLVSLLMVLYPFGHETGTSNFSLGDLIVLLVVLLQIYGAVRRPLPLPRYAPHVLCLAVVALASAVVNVVVLEPYFTGVQATLVETLKLVMAALWMCAIYWLLEPQFGLRFLQLAYTSVVVAGIAAVGAIAKAADPRSIGPFENSNLFGAYLCLNAFLTLAAHGVVSEYAEREARPAPYPFRLLRPLLLPVVLPLLVVGIVATGSRGALIGTIAGATLSGFLRLRGMSMRRVLAALAVVAVLGGGLGWYVRQGPLGLERLVRSADGDARGAAERLLLWRTAGEAFVSHPVLGLGYGQFRNYAQIETGENRPAHQTYLSIAAELGVVGVVVFGWLLFAVLRDSMRSVGPYTVATRAGLGYMVALMVQGLFVNVQHSRALWICIGIIAVQSRPMARRWAPAELDHHGLSVWREP